MYSEPRRNEWSNKWNTKKVHRITHQNKKNIRKPNEFGYEIFTAAVARISLFSRIDDESSRHRCLLTERRARHHMHSLSHSTGKFMCAFHLGVLCFSVSFFFLFSPMRSSQFHVHRNKCYDFAFSMVWPIVLLFLFPSAASSLTEIGATAHLLHIYLHIVFATFRLYWP